jgi:hypothetical protein
LRGTPLPVVELDYAPFAYQQELHLSTARFTVIAGGRRVGKSKMALQELIKCCLTKPGSHCWWVAPTISMAREIGWEEFRESFMQDLGPALQSTNEALGRVRFRNGSTIYFKGSDSERSLRGRGLNYVVVDEAAFVAEEAWTQSLLPALADQKGRALLISTPNGRNWFWKMCNFAYLDRTGMYRYFHWPSFLNPLMDAAEMELMRSSVSEQDFRQEFLAEFVTRGGAVYSDFGEENIIKVPYGQLLSPNPHNYDIYLGIDFGYANPAAVCFMAVDHTTEEVTQFDELYVTRAKIDVIEHMIVEKLQNHGMLPENVRYVYVDPAGNAEDLQMGISPVDFLRQSPFRWRVINKKSLIAPGLALVRSFVRASSGLRRYFVTSNCGETIRSLQGYTYSKKVGSELVKEEPEKDGLHDHMCDAIRYFFVNRFDQAKYVADMPDQANYSQDHKTWRQMTMKRCSRCKNQYPSRTPRGVPPNICKRCCEL